MNQHLLISSVGGTDDDVRIWEFSRKKKQYQTITSHESKKKKKLMQGLKALVIKSELEILSEHTNFC